MTPTARDNGIHSPRKLLDVVLGRLLTRRDRPSLAPPSEQPHPLDYPEFVRSRHLDRISCGCFDEQRDVWSALESRGDESAEYRRQLRALDDVPLHAEEQDTDCTAWKRLLELVEEAAQDGRELFAPLYGLAPGDETKIVTLPPTIAKLKAVRRLCLLGSSVVSIPPEIGEMSALEVFDPYSSYRLHWFPYEITRCMKLRYSRVSTRALYGNFKHRWTFPSLDGEAVDADASSRRCSVCDRPFDHAPHRRWISLWVATDVLPLLVNACSEECIQRLPTPAEGYVPEPHRGRVDLEQPDTSFGPPGAPPWAGEISR